MTTPSCWCDSSNRSPTRKHHVTSLRRPDFTAENVDNLLVQELNELSVAERNRIYEELHGVADPVVEETPEFLAERLKEMRKAMNTCVPKQRRKAFERAVFLRPSLENDDNMLLMFLRADRYDATSAAKRLLLHFEHKLELFGDAKLPKKITLDDLDEDDMHAMETCFFLGRPEKDQSGRVVVFIDLQQLRLVAHGKNLARLYWYVYMALAEDIEVQKRGIVHCGTLYGLTFDNSFMTDMLMSVAAFVNNLPLHTVAYHSCYNDARVAPFMAIVKTLAGKSMRVRLRNHFGSSLETAYSLRSFGIRREVPGAGDSSRRKHLFLKYLESRKKIEADYQQQEDNAIHNSGIIPHPLPNDVLVGRGRSFWTFDGNQILNGLLDDYKGRYAEGDERLDKTIIALEAASRIHDKGGRFLQRTDGGWKLADLVIVREKICQALRIRLRQGDAADISPNTARTSLDVLGGSSGVVQHVAKRVRLNDGNDC